MKPVHQISGHQQQRTTQESRQSETFVNKSDDKIFNSINDLRVYIISILH